MRVLPWAGGGTHVAGAAAGEGGGAGPWLGPLRVAIAEDHFLVREGTRRSLEDIDGIQVVATVGAAAELLEAVERLRPDAVITDIRMPPGHGTEGMQAAHRIRASHPRSAW